MNILKYQSLIEQTAIFPKETGITYCALGLTGEAGEVAEKIKKHIRDGKELDRHAVAKELGDVLWYITAMGREIGYGLELLMQINYDKLILRKETNTLQGSGDDRELKASKQPCLFCESYGMECDKCLTSNKPL